MGGSGSGRWNEHDKRRTVEESWTLDVAALSLRAPLSYPFTGTVEAIRIVGAKNILPVRYALTQEDGPALNLTYAPPTGLHDGKVDESLGLLTTKPNLGGVRWWFACPFAVEGERCKRRVAKLYLPPGENKFGCRSCHNLTYESSQESHKYDSLYAHMTAYDSSGRAYEAIKAIFSEQRKQAKKWRKENAKESGLLRAFERQFGLDERS